MEISILTDNKITEITAGVIIAILSFLLGHKRGKKDGKKKFEV